jgi:hypothetical protein
MLTDLDKVIVRAWSSMTARGFDATPFAIAALLAVDVEGVAKRMAALRAKGQIP